MTSKRGSAGYQSTQVTSDRKLKGQFGSSFNRAQASRMLSRSTTIVISSRSNFTLCTTDAFHPTKRATAGWFFNSSIFVIGGGSAIRTSPVLRPFHPSRAHLFSRRRKSQQEKSLYKPAFPRGRNASDPAR